MVVKIYKDYDVLGKACATMFGAQVLKKPDSVLGFATGSTPLSTYKAMAELYEQGVVDYSQVRTFNLDEYYKIVPTAVQSYYAFMHDNLFNHINAKEENIHILNGMAPDANAECEQYEAAIKAAGGVDLQILGIGHNGHIGFNEPCDEFPDITHIVDLTESTINANTRFFSNSSEVPRQALSMGIGTIMRAKEIVMVITGEAKAPAVKAMLEGPVVPTCPASILQYHPNVTVLLDECAAKLL